MLCQFLLYSKGNQLHVYIYVLILIFFSHIDHYRVLGRTLGTIQQIPISYLFYIQQFVCVNPNFPIYPSLSPLVTLNLYCAWLLLHCSGRIELLGQRLQSLYLLSDSLQKRFVNPWSTVAMLKKKKSYHVKAEKDLRGNLTLCCLAQQPLMS